MNVVFCDFCIDVILGSVSDLGDLSLWNNERQKDTDWSGSVKGIEQYLHKQAPWANELNHLSNIAYLPYKKE